jgi:hypothetical protein
LVLYIFRENIENSSKLDQDSILSPTSGTIESIQTVTEKQNDLKFIKITIKKEIIDSGSIYALTDMKITSIKSQNGLNLALANSLSYLKKNLKVVFKKDQNDIVLTIQEGIVPFNTHFSYNHSICEQGEILGFFVDGSVTIYLPNNSKLSAYQGQKLEGGKTVLGYFSNE